MYYPVQGGDHEYVPLLFIGGFYGLLPADLYDDFLERITRKGYVVISPWPAGDPSLETLVATLEWVNVPLKLLIFECLI